MIYLVLFWTFLKVGAFTFGGGYATLPLIEDEVISHGWLTEQEIVNFIAVSESTPGPFAVNISTYVGMQAGGLFGAFCATLGVVIPAFAVILVIAKFFDKFKSNRVVLGCMSGLRPAVIGLIASSVISIAKTVFFPNGVTLNIFGDISTYISLVIFSVMLVFIIKKVNPILIICLSAAVGIGAGYAFGL